MVRKNPSEFTSISILKASRERLVKFGKYGDNMDSIIERVIDMAQKYQVIRNTSVTTPEGKNLSISTQPCNYHNPEVRA